MKKALFLVLFLSIRAQADLVVYTYDSLTGKDSLGAMVETQFSKVSKTKIRWAAFGSSGEAVSQLVLEGKKTSADVLWGLDQSQRLQAEKGVGFLSYPKALETELNPEALVDETSKFLPYDFGYLAFVYDSKRTTLLPKNLKDLAENSAFHKKVVVQDPRTSSLGLGLLVWVNTLFPAKEVSPFWKTFSRQVVTTSPGWSAAYGMFLKKEADFVLSYTTSPAYHVQHEKTDQYKAVLFPEGHYRQTELASIVATTKQKVDAELFLKTLVSKEVQDEVALRQWMYPVRKDTKLPKSFEALSVPKSVTVDFKRFESERKNWTQEWLRSVVKGH